MHKWGFPDVFQPWLLRASAKTSWELTRWPLVRGLLRQRALNWLLMTISLVGFALAILAGILGTAAGSANFGIVFVWIVWWGLLMGVLLPLGGRAWCLICPIPAPGEWAQRGALVAGPAPASSRLLKKAHLRRWRARAALRRTRKYASHLASRAALHLDLFEQPWRKRIFQYPANQPDLLQIAPAASSVSGGSPMGRPWPRRWQGIWLQNFGFLGVALFSTVILTRPAVTGWVLLAFLLASLALAFVFERRAFCRYVCPVGGFIGLYSLVSPLTLRVRDPEVCRDHQTKDCYLGNEAGYGCPWMERPWAMDRNAYCGLCGECLRTCPKDNVVVALRRPGTGLLVAHGWRLDEAYKAFIMLACAAIYPIVFLGPWGSVKAWADLEAPGGFAIYALGFLTLNLVGVPGLHLGVAMATRWAAGLQDVPLRRLFVALAYPLVPLGLAAWVAFTLSFVFANLSYALPVLSDPFGWGWNLLGTRDVAWQPWLTGWVQPLQAVTLMAGMVGAILTADAILRKLGSGKGVLGALAIQSVTLVAETVFFLWLYLGSAA